MKRWTALLALGLVAAMSGCGADGGAGGSASGGGTAPGGGSGSATSVDPTAGTGTPAPSPGPTDDTPAPIVDGEMLVTLDAGGYAVGRVIRVTVTNGMDRPVYTEDFKTACSIVILQRQDGGAWTDITGCALGRPTQTVTIEPGSVSTVELDPASSHLTNGGRGPAFGAGNYRVKFTFSVEAVATGTDPQVAFSPVFEIR